MRPAPAQDCSVCLSFWVSPVEALGPVSLDQGLPCEGTVYPLRPDSPQLWLRLLLQNDGDVSVPSTEAPQNRAEAVPSQARKPQGHELGLSLQEVPCG